MMIPANRVKFVNEMEEELQESEEQLRLLREVINQAKEDYELFERKLKEVENERS
jgi:hypothetical protein